MAWIAIHEQVIGGKLRTLAKEIGCSQNEALGMLVRLWLWGINNADQEGKIIGATQEDVAEVLYLGIADGIDSLKAVKSLIDTNWIEFDGDLYLHDWSEWQGQWYKAMAAREKDKERKRKERAEKKLAAQEKDDTKIQAQPIVNRSQAADGYSNDFEEWWEVYPRKIGKGDAYKKYKTRLKDGWSPEELMEAARNYRTKVLNERTEEKYIKHPKTFLSDTTPFADFIKHDAKVEKAGSEDDPYGEWRR